MVFMRYLFVLNPKSGPRTRAQNLVRKIDGFFHKSRHDYEFAFTTGPGDATEIARDAINDRFDVVVASGGDGTVNEVATSLIHSDAALGIIPLGSGNGIARSLSIPVNLNKSIPLLLDYKTRKIDVGKINQNFFIGVAGIGFDAVIGMKFQEFGTRGPVPYFLIGIREFLRYRSPELTLQFNKTTLKTRPQLIAIANTKQYGNGALIAPDAVPDDGILNICIIDELSVARAIPLTFKLFLGTIARSGNYQTYQCESLVISSDQENIIVHTDGEPHVLKNSLNIILLKKALRVCTN